MNQTPSRGQGRYNPQTPKKPLAKGLFSDGIWKCNCEPRMPADHFQTKNGGPNHGRWFYTCQRKRCKFFLWDSDAKPREARAVLNNSNSEPLPGIEPNTPNKITPSKDSGRSPITPYSKSNTDETTSNLSSRPDMTSKTKSDNDWLYISDDDLGDADPRKHVDQVGMPPPQTPTKSIKRDQNASPSKRNYEEYQTSSSGRLQYPKPTADIELFNTPNDQRGRGLFAGGRTDPETRGTDRSGGLMSPGITPATNRFDERRVIYDSSEKIPVQRDDSPTTRKGNQFQYHNLHDGDRDESPTAPKQSIEMTPLAKQILDAMQNENAKITEGIANAVKAISLRFANELKTTKASRDYCRDLIKKKDIEIAELKSDKAKLKGIPTKY